MSGARGVGAGGAGNVGQATPDADDDNGRAGGSVLPEVGDAAGDDELGVSDAEPKGRAESARSGAALIGAGFGSSGLCGIGLGSSGLAGVGFGSSGLGGSGVGIGFGDWGPGIGVGGDGFGNSGSGTFASDGSGSDSFGSGAFGLLLSLAGERSSDRVSIEAGAFAGAAGRVNGRSRVCPFGDPPDALLSGTGAEGCRTACCAGAESAVSASDRTNGAGVFSLSSPPAVVAPPSATIPESVFVRGSSSVLPSAVAAGSLAKGFGAALRRCADRLFASARSRSSSSRSRTVFDTSAGLSASLEAALRRRRP
ncbi:MAG: hypothetical protein WCE70_04790, partial [Rhodanobacteraceae bacterium]